MKKILIVSSSSGGHVYPSLILGEELIKRGYKVTYAGIKNQIEEKIIANLITYDIPNSFKKALSFNGIKKLHNSKKNIKELIESNDVVIGFGGFITFIFALI